MADMRRISLIFFIFLIIVGTFYFLMRTQSGMITIVPGDTVSSVANLLAKENIARASGFKIGFYLWRVSAHVYPGQYKISTDCSLRCVVRTFTTPAANSQRLTITEGMDLRDIDALLQKRKIGTPQELFLYTGAPMSGKSREGYLFPDTYDIGDGGVAALVKIAEDNFNKRVLPLAKKYPNWNGHSLREIVIMASILEREVRGTNDRRLVADLLWRRLKKGMGLQVDSSVQYVTAKEGRFTSAADRARDSLWNTYKYRGLPAGPISNPGLDAIEAALSPTANSFWYYLTAPDGKVYYARTLDEHNSNKKFLK